MDELRDALEIHADGFSGEIFRPGDAGFDDARAVRNAMIDRQPGVIARCRDAKDLPITIRAGGHNVAGHAVCGGALWRDVDAASQAHELAMPEGLISDTYDPQNRFRFNQNIQPEA